MLVFPKNKFFLSLWQWIVLIQRNFRVFFFDKLNLSLIFLQVPLIAMLIIVAFYHFERDKENLDEATRMLYYFGVLKNPLEQADKTINIDTLHRYARTLALEKNFSIRHEYIQKTIKPFFEKKNVPVPDLTFTYLDKKRHFISDVASIRRGSVFFLLVAAAIWFGIMGSCKEIVTEQPLLKRESRSYLFILPYLSAKLFVLSVILLVQTGLLSLMVVPLLLALSWIDVISIWMILWVAAFVSATLGLFISSIVSSYRAALTLVPLLMIPQLLFGGLLRPQVDLNDNLWSSFTNALSTVTIQRWAFESILTRDAYANGGILKLVVNSKASGEFDIVQAQNSSLVRSFFKIRKWGEIEVGSLWPPLLYLLSASLIFFIGGYIALRWRLT